MGNYALDFYRQMLVSLRRGNYRGIISNAKPIFFLSLIEFIPYAKKNLFVVEDKKLNTIYKWYMKMYGAINTTPISYPYFLTLSLKKLPMLFCFNYQRLNYFV